MARLDLVHDAELHVAQRRVGRRRHHRDRDAARLEPGRGRPGSVDRIDDEDGARTADLDVAAVFGVERDVAGLAGSTASTTCSAISSIAMVTSPPGRDTDPLARSGIAERRRDRVAHARREIDRERLHDGIEIVHPVSRHVSFGYPAGTSARS